MSGKDNVSSNLVLPCGISLAPNSRLGVSFFHLLEHVLQGLHIVMEAKHANHGRSISSLVKALLNEKAGFDLLQQKTKAATANLANVQRCTAISWNHFSRGIALVCERNTGMHRTRRILLLALVLALAGAPAHAEREM